MLAGIFSILISAALMLYAGLWPMGRVAANNIHIVCPLVIAFSVTALWEINRKARYGNVPLGAWLMLAPFLFGFAALPRLIVACAGLAVAVLALLPRHAKGRYGGGWKSLFSSMPDHLRAADEAEQGPAA